MPWGDEEIFRTSRQISRNVVVSGRRTSMRLESSMWEALEEIARSEGRTLNELCNLIDVRRGEMSLTGAVRAALVSYYRDELYAFRYRGQARADNLPAERRNAAA